MTMSRATVVVDRSDVLEMWADSVVENRRYSTVEDRILARYESDYPSLMPSSDELSDMGFDIIGLAMALEAGLDAEMFGKAYSLLDVAEFNIKLLTLGAGMDIALYNEGLSHLADIVAERA